MGGAKKVKCSNQEVEVSDISNTVSTILIWECIQKCMDAREGWGGGGLGGPFSKPSKMHTKYFRNTQLIAARLALVGSSS